VRYGRLLDDILRKNRHTSGEEILGLLDGELPARDAERVRRHLERCWNCRAEAERTGAAVTGFVEYRKNLLAGRERRFTGLPGWEARLGDEPAPGPPMFRLRHAALAAVGLLAFVFLGLRLTSTDSVSAADVIANARRAELAPISNPGLVQYRKLSLRRRQQGSEPVRTAEFEIWSDGSGRRVRHSGEPDLLVEIETIFAANRRGSPPLSAAGFDSWRNSVKARKETVTAVSKGDIDLLTVTEEAYGVIEANAISKAQLAVRKRDWVPLAENFTVGPASRSRDYEVEALESRLVSRAASPFAPPSPATAVPPAAERAPSIPAEPAVSSGGMLDEIAAHYALHKLGECLDGAIEIVPSVGKLTVKGVVESESRLAELHDALADVPAVRLEVQVPHVATDALVPLPAQAETPPAEGASSPAGDRIRRYFESTGGGARAGEQAAALADRAVSIVGDIRRNAWALRRLAERFSSLGAGRSAASASLLKTMVSDHAEALQSESATLRDLLSPLLDAVSPGAAAQAGSTPPAVSDWAAASSEIFESQRTMETLVHELFIRSSGDASFDASAAQLRQAIAILQAKVQVLKEIVP